MCGIAGFVSLSPGSVPSTLASFLTNSLVSLNLERGPDAIGVGCYTAIDSETYVRKKSLHDGSAPIFNDLPEATAYLIGMRGIPTTEASAAVGRNLPPSHIHPMAATDGRSSCHVVHNGTISNDAALSEGWGRVHHELEHDIDTIRIAQLGTVDSLTSQVGKLEGSWAFAAVQYKNNTLSDIVLSRTYLGLHIAVARYGGRLILLWSSEPLSDHKLFQSQMFYLQEYVYGEMAPYTTVSIANGLGSKPFEILRRFTEPSNTGVIRENSVAVVLSGGLDSTTVAYMATKKFGSVHLLHFDYGCHATANERSAVDAIFNDLAQKHANVHLTHLSLPMLKTFGGSSLTTDRPVSEGDYGAETDSEWVPARNLLMLSVAAAYCDANQIPFIALGANREESGAYNDNSSEFLQRLDATLLFSTKNTVQLWCPLQNKMKHHIVALAKDVGVPFNLTWSCYHGNSENQRCGKCGPCLNTHRAFLLAGMQDPLEYA